MIVEDNRNSKCFTAFVDINVGDVFTFDKDDDRFYLKISGNVSENTYSFEFQQVSSVGMSRMCILQNAKLVIS
jgi:hypothetical protein